MNVNEEKQPETEKIKTVQNRKLAGWLKTNALLIFSIVGVVFYGFQLLENSRLRAKFETENEKMQEKINAEANNIRQMIIHSNETDFALRLTGLKHTATITENAMMVQYQQNLERLAHAKKSGCGLPATLENAIALPNYVPVATIYLQEKQKIQEKENY